MEVMFESKLRSKKNQRVVGLIIFLVNLVLTTLSGRGGLSQEFLDIGASMLFPAFAIMGIGLILFPIDPETLKAKWGVEKVENIIHVPGVWWIIIVISILCGVGNFFLLT